MKEGKEFIKELVETQGYDLLKMAVVVGIQKMIKPGIGLTDDQQAGIKGTIAETGHSGLEAMAVATYINSLAS